MPVRFPSSAGASHSEHAWRLPPICPNSAPKPGWIASDDAGQSGTISPLKLADFYRFVRTNSDALKSGNGAQERHRITCSPLIAIARFPLNVPYSFAAHVAYLFVDDRH